MKIIILFIIISFSLFAQERVLLHIGRDGRQEAIPLKKGENPAEIISSRENRSSSMIEAAAQSNGMVERLQNYLDLALGTKFGFYHQDVALQWFKPNAGGKVKEFWWLNSEKQGNIKKGTIRAWLVDPRLATRPKNIITKQMGYYRDASDGDGLVTPFKPSIGNNQWFYKAIAADSSTWGFDPLGEEVKSWRPGNGLQVNLDSNKWQGIKLEEWGDSMFVKQDQLFGFTLSNDTKKSDIPVGGIDERMEILSWPSVMQAPYHSLKFYETASGVYFNGWYLRGDYDWGMYVLIEYTTDRSPSVSVPVYSTTLKTTPRTIIATITDDNPGGGPAGIKSARLFRKKGSIASYDSTAMTASGDAYSALAPAGNPGDTIYWYITATDVNGNRTVLPSRNYTIFKKVRSRLFIYNNAQYSLATGYLIYAGGSTFYDRWSAPNDGISELPDLLSKYCAVLLADGSFPAKNVYPAVADWLKTGSTSRKKQLFFTSQDYGCFINGTCADTTFGATAWEKTHLGVTTLGPQDQGLTNRPVKIVAQSDTVTNYIIKYNAENSTTLWHDPTFELGFSAYPDFMTIEPTAKALFKNAAGTNVYGVKNSGATFNTMFLALDAGALQFRGDTSLHNAGYTTVTDPKYQWIVDVQSLSNRFFEDYYYCSPIDDTTTAVQNDVHYLYNFALIQNYPNPFNPTADIGYEVQYRTAVSIIVYNALGQNVMTLVNTVKDPGRYTVSFDGRALSSGIYFYEMRAGSFVSSKKMLLLK
jgi:hypothetical protein